jgi:hypothetical protein
VPNRSSRFFSPSHRCCHRPRTQSSFETRLRSPASWRMQSTGRTLSPRTIRTTTSCRPRRTYTAPPSSSAGAFNDDNGSCDCRLVLLVYTPVVVGIPATRMAKRALDCAHHHPLVFAHSSCSRFSHPLHHPHTLINTNTLTHTGQVCPPSAPTAVRVRLFDCEPRQRLRVDETPRKIRFNDSGKAGNATQNLFSFAFVLTFCVTGFTRPVKGR